MDLQTIVNEITRGERTELSPTGKIEAVYAPDPRRIAAMDAQIVPMPDPALANTCASKQYNTLIDLMYSFRAEYRDCIESMTSRFCSSDCVCEGRIAPLVKRNIKQTDRRITMGYLYGDSHSDVGCGFRNAWWMGNHYAEVREQHGVYISTQDVGFDLEIYCDRMTQGYSQAESMAFAKRWYNFSKGVDYDNCRSYKVRTVTAYAHAAAKTGLTMPPFIVEKIVNSPDHKLY